MPARPRVGVGAHDVAVADAAAIVAQAAAVFDLRKVRAN
jgi:hypothetical protein